MTRTVAWLLLIVGLLGGVIWLGRWSQGRVQSDDRYQIAFHEIDCPSPPGLLRTDFLDEIRYGSRLPDRVGLLDTEGHRRLLTAFAKHPWVAKVESIDAVPPKALQVRLVFREPALAVPWEKGWRAVDVVGVLLPTTAPTEGLPKFKGTPRPPSAAGIVWNDPEVIRQAAAISKPRP